MIFLMNLSLFAVTANMPSDNLYNIRNYKSLMGEYEYDVNREVIEPEDERGINDQKRGLIE